MALRMSEKNRGILLFSHIGSEISAKEELIEFEKAEANPESLSLLRKKLEDCVFKSLLKRKLNSDNVRGTTQQSAGCENCFLLGICVLCSKEKRISFDSQEKELCTCYATSHKDLCCSSTCMDGVDEGAVVASESSEMCQCGKSLKEIHSDLQMNDRGTVCAVCNNDGELLCCEGKDCKRRYHLSCLDHCLPEDLPGVKHCPKCVNKKLEYGVYSVSEGVESIWGVREVDAPNTKETRQRQYLVKYHGLAHIHNHWVPEELLLLKNQSIVSSFIAKDKTTKWSLDWTVPYRLLRKKPIQSKILMPCSEDVPESYEWLVKWHGLDYDHATWELDSSYFLRSSLGQFLMNEYEIRRGYAKRINQSQKGCFVELLELPANALNVTDNFVLQNVNKMRERWYNCHNTVVFDDKDQVVTLVFLITSLLETSHPFLIVAASDSSSRWEAEFARLAPSVSVVVYSGNTDARKKIRASEFYEESGCVMLQVLLSSPEAVVEDLELLSCMRWHCIMIDEHEHSRISIDLEEIKILSTDVWTILLSSQLEDATSEYLNILSLLDSEHEYNKLRGLRSGKNKHLAKLKERLSRFIAYGSTSKLSKFCEYWVPVHISSLQVEQYCSILISNSMLLCSSSRNDKFGAFKDILLSVKKCCDHPYLVGSSIQEQMIAEGHSADEILDVGIKASGKLQLLDMVLKQVKALDLKALLLFQSVESGRSSIGYILNDFLAEKFGQTSFECIFAGVSPRARKSAVNRFNMKENEKFVLLLENRACCSDIKLASLDLIVLYNSDWNPANDYKSLQKVSIDLDVNQIKIFRLYSSCTVEERALVLSKKNINDLDNTLQTLSRTISDSLLMWGASYLFGKLNDYHAESIYGPPLLNEIAEEFQSILSGRGEITHKAPVISKVKLDVASYSANVPLLGEAKIELKGEEEPHVFWTTHLGKIRSQQKIIGQCQRSRKRARYLENDNAGNKCRRASIEDAYQVLTPVKPQEQVVTKVADPEGDCRDDVAGRSTFSTLPDRCGAEERNVLSDEQKSTQSLLLEEAEKLCRILKLPGDVTHALRRFIEYIISNHRICRDSPEFMQAFLVSLLWVAASISKHEVNKTESIILAKKFLNYQCTEELVHSVYAKMLDLKWLYLQCTIANVNLDGDHFLADKSPKDEKLSINNSSLINLQDVKMEIEENSTHEEHREGLILSQQKLIDAVNEIQRRCDKRMRKLVQKQKREALELYQNWELKRLKSETDHKLALELIRCIYAEGSERMVKLKVLDHKFAKEMEENNLVKEKQLKELEARQLSALDQEREKVAHWISSVKANWSSKLDLFSTRSTPPEAVEANANQPKLIGEVICADLLTSGENILDKIAAAELNKQIPPKVPEKIPCGVVDNVNSEKKTKDKASGVLPLAAQILEPSVLQEASWTVCYLLSPQVPEDQAHRSLSTELQDQGPCAVDDQNTIQFKVGFENKILAQAPEAQAMENSVQLNDVSTNVSSRTRQSMNIEIENNSNVSERNSQINDDADTNMSVQDQKTSSNVPDQDAPTPTVDDHETLPIEGTYLDARAIENQMQLNHESVDVSPGENQSTTIEVESQSHVSRENSSQITKGAEIEILMQESCCIDQILEKSFQEAVSWLKTDCEKELQEVTAQVHRKYQLKLVDAELKYLLKKNVLDAKKNKVVMNQKLSTTFRSACEYPQPSQLPGIEQEVASTITASFISGTTPCAHE